MLVGSFSMGFAAITDKIVKETKTSREDWPIKYEIRQGFAIFGYACSECDDPFDDCVIMGKGYTMEAATRIFEGQLKETIEGIWV